MIASLSANSRATIAILGPLGRSLTNKVEAVTLSLVI